jgi:DNA-binding transcriptional LysR family regulator
MELMQLEMFVALVEERSVRKAAERVFRTQPAISISLGKLANEIGTPLFEGPRRGARELTSAGQMLYEYALQILGLRNEALSRLKVHNHPAKAHICIAADRGKRVAPRNSTATISRLPFHSRPRSHDAIL